MLTGLAILVVSAAAAMGIGGCTTSPARMAEDGKITAQEYRTAKTEREKLEERAKNTKDDKAKKDLEAQARQYKAIEDAYATHENHGDLTMVLGVEYMKANDEGTEKNRGLTSEYKALEIKMAPSDLEKGLADRGIDADRAKYIAQNLVLKSSEDRDADNKKDLDEFYVPLTKAETMAVLELVKTKENAAEVEKYQSILNGDLGKFRAGYIATQDEASVNVDAEYKVVNK